jgi:hypothetical protein
MFILNCCFHNLDKLWKYLIGFILLFSIPQTYYCFIRPMISYYLQSHLLDCCCLMVHSILFDFRMHILLVLLMAQILFIDLQQVDYFKINKLLHPLDYFFEHFNLYFKVTEISLQDLLCPFERLVILDWLLACLICS